MKTITLIRPALISAHGGYRKLVTYSLGNLIYDATVAFCENYLSRKDRTYDQMVQAARSGVANIIEASEAGAASKKTELKLTNVAKASHEELLSDYLAFLRQHDLSLWNADSLHVQMIRKSRPADLNQLRLLMASIVSDFSGKVQKDKKHALLQEVACNTMITLINQETYLLKRQIARLAKDFEEYGGFTERLYRVRKAIRTQQSDLSDMSDSSDFSSLKPKQDPATFTTAAGSCFAFKQQITNHKKQQL